MSREYFVCPFFKNITCIYSPKGSKGLRPDHFIGLYILGQIIYFYILDDLNTHHLKYMQSERLVLLTYFGYLTPNQLLLPRKASTQMKCSGMKYTRAFHLCIGFSRTYSFKTYQILIP